jgi:hypothetical protein
MADEQPGPIELDSVEPSPGLVIEEAPRRDSYTMLFFLIEGHLHRKVAHEFVEPADVTDQWIFQERVGHRLFRGSGLGGAWRCSSDFWPCILGSSRRTGRQETNGG